MKCCDRPNVRACEYPGGFWVYFCLACGEKLNHWGHKRWFGVDVARFGDDRTVLFPRQGLAGEARARPVAKD